MFKDFEKVKSQLKELSDIINSFKSEAVQVRLIEILLSGDANDVDTAAGSAQGAEPAGNKKRAGKRRKKQKQQKSSAAGDEKKDGSTKKRAASGSGAVATFRRAFDDGFLKSPRTIGQICDHCDVKFAKRIKPNEISGTLARMVRSGQLNRTKNEEGQYEYTEA